jgi:uncharacterized protein YxjI
MPRLLFKQRFFSWFDSYDIYDEDGRTAFTVQGRLAWGHKLEIYNREGHHIGTVKEEILTFLPRFAIYLDGRYAGCIRKELTLFRPRYTLDLYGWQVQGDFFGWDYQVVDPSGSFIMQASKQLFNWTDTYVIDIADPAHTLLSLMIVLAIDAANCSNN